MTARIDQLYRFPDGWLDVSRNLLVIGERREVLKPIRGEVLAYLMSQAGRVVSKEELLREVWEGRAVSEEALTGSIYELRKILGDNPRQPTFIETVRKRGYRWIPGPSSRVPAGFEETAETRASRFKEQRWLLAGLGISVLLAGLSYQDVAPGRALDAPAVADREVQENLGRAQHFLRRARPLDLKLAEESFQHAVELDPTRAEALAGLAQTYVLMAEKSMGDRFELYHAARTRARSALELDPELAAAHAALGIGHMVLDWDFVASEKSFRRALELDPSYARAHEWYSWLLSALGRLAEAEAEARTAISLNPASVGPYASLAFTMTQLGRFDAAAAAARRGIEIDDQHRSAWAVLWHALWLGGDFRAAVAVHQKILESRGVPAGHLERMRASFEREGFEAYLEDYDQLLENQLVEKARVAAAIGQHERALEHLARAARKRSPAMIWLAGYPELQPLHDDPAFRELVSEVGVGGVSPRRVLNS